MLRLWGNEIWNVNADRKIPKQNRNGAVNQVCIRVKVICIYNTLQPELGICEKTSHYGVG